MKKLEDVLSEIYEQISSVRVNNQFINALYTQLSITISHIEAFYEHIKSGNFDSPAIVDTIRTMTFAYMRSENVIEQVRRDLNIHSIKDLEKLLENMDLLKAYIDPSIGRKMLEKCRKYKYLWEKEDWTNFEELYIKYRILELVVGVIWKTVYEEYERRKNM
jgi:hypothetical protein